MADWYQIENNIFTVQFSSQGAELKRLFAKPWSRELLWVPTHEKDIKIWNRSAPILFPIVGKLKNDQYHYQGKNYELSQHGFARDMEFECVVCGTNEIEFKLSATQESFKSYPFCFELNVKYVLSDNMLNVTYTVANVDRQDIYFSIGAHPGFATSRLSEYEIHFEKKEKGFFRLVDKMPDWSKSNPMDSNELKPTKEMFFKDALIFKDVKSKYVDLVNVRRHEIIRLHRGSAPYFGIWGKDDVPFICLEPWWGISDEASHDQNLENKKGIYKLPMGESVKFSFGIELITG
ncbi:MAG: aldose 1-epimerase family protein [Bacteriovorax sp.]